MAEHPEHVTQEWLDRHIEKVPYHMAIGIHFVAGGDDWISCAFEWKGTAAPPAGHIMTLLDATCGVAVISAARASRAATLSLRIEHLAPLPNEGRFLAQASCHHVGGSVAFASAQLRFDGATGPLATASASFYFDHS